MTDMQQNGITLEAYLDNNTDIICVFGCLLTEIGKQIKAEMLKWILTKYDTIVVNQEAPGKLFEYPALKMAQVVSKNYNKPVLYLHTKGAAHSKNVYDQTKCRLVWKDEFINHYNEYFSRIKNFKSQVLCPFTGKGHTTILNGFIATTQAWQNVIIPQPTERFRYEHIFNSVKNVEMFGRVMRDVNIIQRDVGFSRMLKYINNFKL